MQDPEITSEEIRTIPTETPGEGVGIVEAPRGTLIHHYKSDEKGLIRRANLIVGTTNNHAAISMSIKKAAQNFVLAGQEISDGILNKIEMAFRAYDPCLGCATHALPGKTPMILRVYDHHQELIQETHRE